MPVKFTHFDMSMVEKVTPAIQKLASLDAKNSAKLEKLFNIYANGIENENLEKIKFEQAKEDNEKLNVAKKIIQTEYMDLLSKESVWTTLKSNNRKHINMLDNIQKKVANEGHYLNFSSKNMMRLHNETLTEIEEWCKKAKKELLKNKRQLPKTFYVLYLSYLHELKNKIKMEKIKIGIIVFDRTAFFIENSTHVDEDDTVFHLREEILSLNLTGKTSLINVNPYQYNSIRRGLNKETVDYFYKKVWHAKERETLIEKILPHTVSSQLKRAGTWMRLPNFLIKGRLLRHRYFTGHLHQLANINVLLKTLKQDITGIKLWSNPDKNHFTYIEHSLNALISDAEKNMPQGIGATLFQSKTKRVFNHYLVDLKNKRENVRQIKLELEKQDKCTQLINACLQSKKSIFKMDNVITDKFDMVQLPNKQVVTKLIEIVKDSIVDASRKEALTVLNKFICADEEILQKPIEELSHQLQPLVVIQGNVALTHERLKILITTLTAHCIVPKCHGANSNAYSFIKKCDNYANSALARSWLDSYADKFADSAFIVLKKFFENFLIEQGNKKREDIYQHIDIVKNASTDKTHYLRHLIDYASQQMELNYSGISDKYGDFISAIDEEALIETYGRKLFHNILEQKHAELIPKIDFFRRHKNNFKLIDAIKSDFLLYLQRLKQRNASFKEVQQLIDSMQGLISTLSDEELGTLTVYVAAWGDRQHYLIEQLGDEKAKQKFYTSWLKGLLKNEYTTIDVNPINNHANIENIISVYGKENLQQIILPAIRESLEKPLSETLMSVIECHLANDMEIEFPECSDVMQSFLMQKRRKAAEIKANNELIKLKKLFFNQEYCLVEEMINNTHSLFNLHIAEPDSASFLYAHKLMEHIEDFLLTQIKLFLIENNVIAIGNILNLTKDIEGLKIKTEVEYIYHHHDDIWINVAKFGEELISDLNAYKNELRLVDHQLSFNMTLLADIRHAPFNHYLAFVKVLNDLAKQLPINNPLEKGLLHVANYLKNGRLEEQEHYHYIDHHTDYKLIMNCLKAIRYNQAFPIKKEEFNNCISRLLESPYLREEYRSFWQGEIDLCMHKPEAVYLADLVKICGDDKQKHYLQERMLNEKPAGNFVSASTEINDKYSKLKANFAEARDQYQIELNKKNKFYSFFRSAFNKMISHPVNEINSAQIREQVVFFRKQT